MSMDGEGGLSGVALAQHFHQPARGGQLTILTPCRNEQIESKRKGTLIRRRLKIKFLVIGKPANN
jgi:hypothetical protein